MIARQGGEHMFFMHFVWAQKTPNQSRCGAEEMHITNMEEITGHLDRVHFSFTLISDSGCSRASSIQ